MKNKIFKNGDDLSLKNKNHLKINCKKIKQKNYLYKMIDAEKYSMLNGNEKERYIFEIINSALLAEDKIEYEVLDA